MIKRTMIGYEAGQTLNKNIGKLAEKLQSIADKISPGSSGLFVGFVTNGQAMPTKRADDTELKDEDYVRPLETSTFPFTTTDNKCTFTTRLSKAIYVSSTQSWVIDIGIVQNTLETPIKGVDESISGTSANQREINLENKIEIESRLKQYLAMPEASASYNNSIIQYIGSTNENYIQGRIYKCEEVEGNYSWKEIIFSSSADGITIEENTENKLQLKDNGITEVKLNESLKDNIFKVTEDSETGILTLSSLNL